MWSNFIFGFAKWLRWYRRISVVKYYEDKTSYTYELLKPPASTVASREFKSVIFFFYIIFYVRGFTDQSLSTTVSCYD